ncbi:MAG: hypothetical protein AAF561_04240 [Planctomycetota bacterium]
MIEDPDSVWSLPPDWYGAEAEDLFYESFTRVTGGRDLVADGTFWNEASKLLNDFWIDLHVFREHPRELEVFEYWGGHDLPIPIGFARGSVATLINADGSYWAVLTDTESLLLDVARRWKLAEIVQVTRLE